MSPLSLTNKPQALVALGAVTAAFVFAYSGAFSLLFKTWSNSSTYSHGVLVPFISAYFAWSMRERLASTPISPSIAAGGIMLLASCFLLVAGHISSVTIVQQASVLFAVPSLILLLLGRRQLRELALPSAYLVFMVPVLDVLINRIQWPFQLLSAKVSVFVLKLFGVSVFLNRQFIELPNITLEVAKACSGVQYLVSIISLAIPLAYINLRGNMRLLLLFLAVVIGIATNWLRVIFIAVWSLNGGEVLHGPMHIFQGMFVAVFGFILLFAVSLVLGRLQRASCAQKENVAASPRVFDAVLGSPRFKHAAACAIVVLLATGIYMHFFKLQQVPLAEPIKKLPHQIAGWKGVDADKSAKKTFHMQGADSDLHRVYTDASGRQIELHIAYFESQSQGRELINHSHNPLYEASVEIEVPAMSGPLKVNHAFQNSGPRDYQVLYWYNVNGKAVSGIYSVKLNVLFDGLLRRRTNGSMVVVSWSPDEANPDKISQGLDFIKDAAPLIDSHLRTL